MKNMQTPSQRFIAVRFDTTGNDDRKLFVVVQKLSIVVTPIITLAGTTPLSNQKLMNALATRMIAGTNTVLK